MRFKTFLTVRSNSKRLTNKAYMKFGEGSTIDHMIRRALNYGLEPIICTTTNPKDDEICNRAREYGVPYFRGPEENKLLRWFLCAEKFNLECFHALDCDDLFFDGESVKKSYELLRSNNVVKPFKESAQGGGSVGYTIRNSVLNSETVKSDMKRKLDNFEGYIRNNIFEKVITMETPAGDVINERLTLDFWTDYILLSVIQIRLGSLATMKEIRELLDQEPWLKELNNLNKEGWKKNQEEEIVQQAKVS